MSNQNLENSITINDIQNFNFESDDLECRICHKTYDTADFTNFALTNYIKKLNDWRKVRTSPRPSIKCFICTHKKPLARFTCSICGIEKLANKFLKEKSAQNDEISCSSCVEKIKKNKGRPGSIFPDSESPAIPNISNTSNSNQQLGSIQNNILFDSSQPNFNNSHLNDRNSNFEVSSIQSLNSENPNIPSHPNIVSISQQLDLVQDNLIRNSDQYGISNSLLNDNDTDGLQPQDQMQYREQEQGHDQTQEQLEHLKALYIPKFDTNIYSLLQLLGRKSPLVSNSSYIPFNASDVYETRDSSDMDTEEDLNSHYNTVPCNVDLAHNQHIPQSPFNSVSTHEAQVSQTNSPTQGYSSSQQNGTNFETNQSVTRNQMETDNIGDDIRQNGINSDNIMGIEEGPTNFVKDSLHIQTNSINADDSNQADDQMPINTQDTAQKSDYLGNISPVSSPSNYPCPDITIGRYRNKTINLSEIFGKPYDPIPSPHPLHTDKDSKERKRENAYQTAVHAQATIRNSANAPTFSSALNTHIRFEITPQNPHKRNYTKFSNS